MIAVGFLHPLLLWALPLALVPIVIHLLNRRRFRRIRWAAMEHLLAALKRNRRRMRMEQWLLLAARVLIVLLLIFFVSRPQLSGSVLGDVRTHHVVCIDDSASMAERSGTSTLFATGLRAAEEMVDGLVEAGANDLITVLRASAAQAPVLRAMNTGEDLAARVRDAFADLRVADGSLEPSALLEQARFRLDELQEASRGEIYLLTDFRRADWLDAEGALAPGIVREIAGLDADRHRLNVVTIGRGDSENLAITEFRRTGRVAPVGVPLRFVARIDNTGKKVSAPAEVAFEIDGQSRILRTVDSLRPNESVEIEITHTFAAPGAHGIEASLPADRYPVDDRRALALDIVESSRALLVDGDPGDAVEEAETFCLAAALEHRQSGIAVEVIPDHLLADRDLSAFDVVYLCNVPAPDAAVVAELETFVGQGGGLVIFAGNQVDPGSYNDAMFRGGAGLLPAELTRLDGDLDRPQSVYLADPDHGTMRTATENLERLFSRLVLVGRWMGVQESADRPAKIVLRVAEVDGSPLLLARPHANGGEVVLVTTTADMHWTNWPSSPAFLVVAQEIHRLVAKATRDDDLNLGPRGRLDLELDPGLYRPDVVVRARVADAVDRTYTAQVEGDDADVSARLTVPMSDLRGFGLFDLQLASHAGASETRLVARNAPIQESALDRLLGQELRASLPDELRGRVEVIEDESEAAVRAGYGEVWRPLALAMLVLMIAESVMAWRFGRR